MSPDSGPLAIIAPTGVRGRTASALRSPMTEPQTSAIRGPNRGLDQSCRDSLAVIDIGWE